jgi:tetratricopeptide (TPR) repeat protein
MLRHLSCAAVGAALLLASASAHADLQSGSDKLAAGDYKGAIADLQKVTGKDKGAAKLVLFEAQLATGDLTGAETTAQAAAGDKDAKIAARGKVALSRVHRATGNFDQAKADVEALYKSDPSNLPVRWAYALVLQDTGHGADAAAVWQTFMDDFDAQKIDIEDPDQLFYLAESARYTAQFQFANDSYREAQALAPADDRTGIAWADLFLQKYASEYADQTLEDVFKVNPNDPDAHAAEAAVIVESSYDLAQVNHHLDQAFAVNPKNVRAMVVKAGIEIDQNQWDAAKATCADILAVNPKSVEALSLLATIAWLRDDMTEYDAQKKAVFAIDAEYAQFYRTVAKSAVREHRYKEAIDLEKEAVKLAPEYYEAMAGVGEGYLRLGDEKEGLKWLDKSWGKEINGVWVGDPYNVRTKNTLDLFEQTIPKEYTFHSTKHFKIRYHKDEQKILSRYVEPMVEEEFATLSKRYGFSPKTPIVLEIYQDPTDYSVRTVGLPNLGALGVCFGQVVTAMSPSSGDLNWGMVIWHELAHVFAIQLSQSRVPRWFTEGLSEYETLTRRPDWRRENDADLYGAVSEGRLPSVAELNYEFMNPDPNAVVVAYYLAAVTIEYIADTYGFQKIVDALKLFAQGKEGPEVVETITGRKVPEFDADFRKYLEVRLAPYKGTFHLPSRGFDDITALEVAADAAPKDAARRVDVALGYYYAGDADGADANAQAALKLDADNAIARYIEVEITLRNGDMAGAAKGYGDLLADGIDNFDIRTRLAQIDRQMGDNDRAVKQLNAAKSLDPERSYPYQELSDLYQQEGKHDQALVELGHYAMIEQMELGPVKTLTAEYAKAGDWAKARTYGVMGTFIDPFDNEMMMDLGRAYTETGDAKDAVFSYETALLSDPPLRRPALAHIGEARAYLKAGDKKKAKAEVAEALKTEPENAEALELQKQTK